MERPGEMDREITIETPTKAQGPSGAQRETFGTFATVWAKVGTGSGNEAETSDQEIPMNKKIFSIWYLDGLTEEMRIVHEGQIYDILRFDEIGRRKGHRIEAERGTEVT